MQSGLQPSTDGTLTAGNHPLIIPYAPPGPPPGSGPHRYCFFLFQQPEGFDPQKYASPGGAPVLKRMRYDFDSFAKEAKLGPVLAANYFTSN